MLATTINAIALQRMTRRNATPNGRTLTFICAILANQLPVSIAVAIRRMHASLIKVQSKALLIGLAAGDLLSKNAKANRSRQDQTRTTRISLKPLVASGTNRQSRNIAVEVQADTQCQDARPNFVDNNCGLGAVSDTEWFVNGNGASQDLKFAAVQVIQGATGYCGSHWLPADAKQLSEQTMLV